MTQNNEKVKKETDYKRLYEDLLKSQMSPKETIIEELAMVLGETSKEKKIFDWDKEKKVNYVLTDFYRKIYYVPSYYLRILIEKIKKAKKHK